jgi:hypothetical protein
MITRLIETRLPITEIGLEALRFLLIDPKA